MSSSGVEIRISIIARCANVSEHCTTTEKSENEVSLCSTAQVHNTTPTRSILEAPEVLIPPYYEHTVVVPTVSA